MFQEKKLGLRGKIHLFPANSSIGSSVPTELGELMCLVHVFGSAGHLSVCVQQTCQTDVHHFNSSFAASHRTA